MRGFEDLKKLSFGTTIYDLKDGERGIVGCLEHGEEIYIIWENSGAIYYEQQEGFLEFSLEKPKKKVNKSMVYYCAHDFLNALTTDMDVFKFRLKKDGNYHYRNKITITYETEE